MVVMRTASAATKRKPNDQTAVMMYLGFSFAVAAETLYLKSAPPLPDN